MPFRHKASGKGDDDRHMEPRNRKDMAHPGLSVKLFALVRNRFEFSHQHTAYRPAVLAEHPIRDIEEAAAQRS